MKNYIFFLALFAMQAGFAGTENDSLSRFHFQKLLLAEDCDACGCSATGGSMGFSSMVNSNFVGLRYFYQSYTSKDGIFNNSPSVDENFNTIQIWARIPVVRRVQITVLAPYHFHTRERTTGNENIEGVGDITALAMYAIFQTQKDSAVFNHKWQVGGGVKFPTGKFDVENNKGSVNPGFQVGTGSWDYLLTTEYVARQNKLGLNTALSYTIKTENRKLYQFGNQFNYGSTLFYLLNLDKVKLVPQAGIAGEVYKGNEQYRQPVPDSSGDVIFSRFGLEAGKDRFSVGANIMLPINQNLSNGKVETNYRWSVNFNYSL